MITIRSFRAEDFPLLMKFWTRHGLAEVPREFLPPTGIVAQADGILLAGGFLVKTDTNQAGIAFLAGNPDVPRGVRSEALDDVILGLTNLAQEAGFQMITAATNVPALQARYKRLGLLKTDENVICFGGII